MQYKLEIQSLTKRFVEKTLFEDLNLTVTGPAILWAPSGWGKTTLLRILMGLEVPTSGTVSGVGRVGAVFQEDRLCPQLNAVQNVELVLASKNACPSKPVPFAVWAPGTTAGYVCSTVSISDARR